jgi:hypothetical protein
LNHYASIINHQSSIINHQSSIINHQSSIGKVCAKNALARWSALWLGDCANHISDGPPIPMARMHTRKPCQIALTDNPDHAIIVVHYRQPPELVARHAPHTILERVIFVASIESFAHALAYPGMARVYATGNDPERDVTIGHYPYQTVVTIDDWQYSTIASTHQTRCALDGLPGINSYYAKRHHISRAHIIQVVLRTSIVSLTVTLSIGLLVQAVATPSLFIALTIEAITRLTWITAMIILNRISFCHLNLLYGYHYFNRSLLISSAGTSSE